MKINEEVLFQLCQVVFVLFMLWFIFGGGSGMSGDDYYGGYNSEQW